MNYAFSFRGKTVGFTTFYFAFRSAKHVLKSRRHIIPIEQHTPISRDFLVMENAATLQTCHASFDGSDHYYGIEKESTAVARLSRNTSARHGQPRYLLQPY